MENDRAFHSTYVPQGATYYPVCNGGYAAYGGSDTQVFPVTSTPVEYRGLYYFDPTLNQPVSSVPWNSGGQGTSQSYNAPAADFATVCSNQPCSNSDSRQGSAPTITLDVKANQQHGSEERNRRKGEPFRYDSRVFNRTRNGCAQAGYHGGPYASGSDLQGTSDQSRSAGLLCTSKPKKCFQERQKVTNQRESTQNNVQKVESSESNCGPCLPKKPSANRQRNDSRGRSERMGDRDKNKERSTFAGSGEASSSGSIETFRGATPKKNSGGRERPEAKVSQQRTTASSRRHDGQYYRGKGEDREKNGAVNRYQARKKGENGRQSRGDEWKKQKGDGPEEKKWSKKDEPIPVVWLTESAVERRNLPKRTEYPQPLRNDDAPQKDRLTEQLMRGDYECMVCCERVKGSDPVWSCSNCYHIYHLQCARKWATSPAALVKEGGWRCPACQHVTKAVPQQYVCFCGKRTNPEWNRYGVPHGCGEMCGRHRGCTHRCTLQCHPGPCPPCAATVRRPCHCGQLVRCVRCSQEQDLSCGERCGRLLNCQIHTCEMPCHAGSCKPCERIVTQSCYCSKKSQEVTCTQEVNISSEYSCGNTCGRPLACGNHGCSKLCHFGECGDCPRLPFLVVLCPCGQTPLQDIVGAEARTSCTDPVPLCGKTCGKELPCGPMGNPHHCSAPCHEGLCPDCPLTTLIRCRCGGTSRDVPCVEAATLEEQTCQRRCQKRRQCGRHKCLVTCCIDTEHHCPLTCGKRLTCGLHVCQEPCHRGNCPTCWNVSFEDLSCHCGSTSLSPPVPCGTRPPECNQPCARPHPCGHPVTHTCHSDDFCPPCPALTEKWCYGKHEKRKAVPCFLEGLSCGLVCGKALSCGQHRCQHTCHAGPCLSGEACEQPCPKPRPNCGHPCAEPCHRGPCASAPCKATVTIACACGHRSERVSCGEGGPAYNQLSASVLATKIQGIQLGESVDIGEVMALSRTKPSKLECNEECAVFERNRRLATALHIQNADLSNRAGPPSYSEFLKEEARKNPSSVTSAYQKLTELVQTAKQSKQKCRSHSFPSMTREQRRMIHELAEFFGCETQSYDCEPYRNVVVTAYKDKCHIPCTSLMSVVQRETGQRKGPAPVSMPWRRDQQPASAFFALSSANTSSAGTSSAGSNLRDESKPAGLDYFNFS